MIDVADCVLIDTTLACLSARMIVCVRVDRGIIHYFLHCTDLKITPPNAAVCSPEISRITTSDSLMYKGGAF